MGRHGIASQSQKFLPAAVDGTPAAAAEQQRPQAVGPAAEEAVAQVKAVGSAAATAEQAAEKAEDANDTEEQEAAVEQAAAAAAELTATAAKQPAPAAEQAAALTSWSLRWLAAELVLWCNWNPYSEPPLHASLMAGIPMY